MFGGLEEGKQDVFISPQLQKFVCGFRQLIVGAILQVCHSRGLQRAVYTGSPFSRDLQPQCTRTAHFRETCSAQCTRTAHFRESLQPQCAGTTPIRKAYSCCVHGKTPTPLEKPCCATCHLFGCGHGLPSELIAPPAVPAVDWRVRADLNLNTLQRPKCVFFLGR